jgi:hypothetical protein
MTPRQIFENHRLWYDGYRLTLSGDASPGAQKIVYKAQDRNLVVTISLLLAELCQGIAEWSAGDLHHSLERAIHLQNQKNRT